MEAWEYNYIRSQTLALTKVDLNCYKAPQMQRRLEVYLARSGYPNWPKFFKAIRDDSLALYKFRDYLTINVSSFFRDPEKYQYLQTVILPELLHHSSRLHIWSAGCSHGQEAYSLAILLAEASKPGVQLKILATDIDGSALSWGKAGGPYTKDELINVSPQLQSRYFQLRPDGYWITDALRHKVTFRQHNLLADPFLKGFDLIICRNVVIYFEPAAKNKLYCNFHDALRPGGVLFVGGTEIVPKAADLGFEATGISFYRRCSSRQSQLTQAHARGTSPLR